MAMLLLDPLVLLLYLGVALYAGLVWRGRFRSWFGARRLWLGAWPLPVVIALVPLIVGPALRAVSALGPVADGGLVAVTAFLLANLVPVVGLTMAPPRVLLPPWARQRLTVAPDHDGPHPDAVPALQASHVEARTSWPRWRWRVDAIAGHAWVADGQLRFRAAAGDERAADHELDQDEIDQWELQLGADAGLRPPRGGWWARHHLDAELAELDGWQVRATRPWDRAGLLVLEVEGRRPVRLWSTRVDRLRRQLTAPAAPAA